MAFLGSDGCWSTAAGCAIGRAAEPWALKQTPRRFLPIFPFLLHSRGANRAAPARAREEAVDASGGAEGPCFFRETTQLAALSQWSSRQRPSAPPLQRNDPSFPPLSNDKTRQSKAAAQPALAEFASASGVSDPVLRAQICTPRVQFSHAPFPPSRLGELPSPRVSGRHKSQR